MKYKAEPKGRPSENGGGSPPAVIDCYLTNVTRTNPHVALGSRSNNLRISSGIRSSVTGESFEKLCLVAKSDPSSVAAPPIVAPSRTCRRPTVPELRFDTGHLLCC